MEIFQFLYTISFAPVRNRSPGGAAYIVTPYKRRVVDGAQCGVEQQAMQ